MNKARVLRALQIAADLIDELSNGGQHLSDEQVEAALEVEAIRQQVEGLDEEAA